MKCTIVRYVESVALDWNQKLIFNHYKVIVDIQETLPHIVVAAIVSMSNYTVLTPYGNDYNDANQKFHKPKPGPCEKYEQAAPNTIKLSLKWASRKWSLVLIKRKCRLIH